MKPVTLFSWGYWGWGNATDQLIRSVDAVEAARGYKPPLFVDIRLSRSVRAPGFNGRAFEDAVGARRYRWLDGLGNLAVKHGGPTRLKDPATVTTLLDIAEAAARNEQRLLFFCACKFPGVEHDGGCHRTMAARLVLEAATQRKLSAQVVEWPGGEPRLEGFHVEASESTYKKVWRGTKSVPAENPSRFVEMAGVPWYSVAEVRPKDDAEWQPFRVLTGPARYKKSGWYLPVYDVAPDDLPAQKVREQVKEWREADGFNVRQSAPDRRKSVYDSVV